MDSKITIIEARIISGDIKYIEGFFETGATLPMDNIATGSNMFNIDTGAVYFFKASTGEWITDESGSDET